MKSARRLNIIEGELQLWAPAFPAGHVAACSQDACAEREWPLGRHPSPLRLSSLCLWDACPSFPSHLSSCASCPSSCLHLLPPCASWPTCLQGWEHSLPPPLFTLCWGNPTLLTPLGSNTPTPSWVPQSSHLFHTFPLTPQTHYTLKVSHSVSPT